MPEGASDPDPSQACGVGTCSVLGYCECPSGYSGKQCENESFACATDLDCHGSECMADGICKCNDGKFGK